MFVTAGAVAVVLVTAALASASTVSRLEVQVFRWLNQGPDIFGRPVWFMMQLGSVVGGLLAAVVLLAVTRQPRGALAGAIAVVAAWLAAKVIKALVDRGRPADYLADVHTRFEPLGYGQGYPSGHTAVAFALATVIAGSLRGWWRGVPFVVATVVAFGRVYFGAHFPLDVVGGAAIGVAIGALTRQALHLPTGLIGSSRPGTRVPRVDPVPDS